MELSLDFRAAVQRHRAKLVAGAGDSFLLSDAARKGWQIIELPHRDVARSTIRLRLALRPIGSGDASFSVQQAPGVEMALIDRDGTMRASKPEAVKAYAAEKGEDGWLNVELLYVNRGPSVVLGLAKPGSAYVGSGTGQFELKDARVEVVEPRWMPTAADPLRIVEAGLRTGADPAWQLFAAGLRIASFAPLAGEAEALQAALPASAGHLVMAKALSDRNGTSPFHVTQNKAHSSIFKPDFQRLKGYPSADEYQIASEVRVETCRLDSLVRQGAAAAPDVVRLDAAGLEYNALRGLGDLLDGVMAVETALYLYPIYRKQKLLADIVDLLESSGLILLRLAPPARIGAQFGGELVKMTAVFMRKSRAAEAAGRYQLLEEIWALPSSF